jgi:hypothetical protein
LDRCIDADGISYMRSLYMKRFALAIPFLLAAAMLTPLQAATAATVTAAPRACTPKLVGLTAPGLVYAGDKPTGTVSLTCAPTAALKLTVTTDDTDLVVPASVTVSKGKSSASIPMTAKANSSGQYAATVTVHNGTQSVSAGITVDPGLSDFELSPGSEPNMVDPNVILTGPAPAGGLTVKVASDNPAVTVPATASFQQYALGGGFPGVLVNPVTVNTTVHISVTLGSRTLTAATVLVPPFNGHDTMKIVAQTPGDIYGLDGSLQYQVVLSNPAPADGLQVALSVPTGSDSLQTDVTSTFVTGGFVEGYFRVSAGDVTKTTHATIEATVDGITATIPVTIQPRLTTVTNVPASIQGGSSFQATVNLAGPADTDTTVYLASSWGILSVPALVVIPAGSTSASFPVTTSTVDSPENVDINASLGEAHATGTVTLTP